MPSSLRRISGNPLAKFRGRIEAMEAVWGTLLSFLFVLALALSGHVETPSKEQIEQIEKAEKEKKEQIEKAEKDKKEQIEKAEKDKKEQDKKSRQKEPDAWRLRP
jgi:Flp pilus assembly protein TadB